jgi:hypothetical protein
MRTTTKLCLVVSLVAAFGLASVPIANAEEPPGSVDLPKAISSKATKKDKKQDKKIKKAGKEAEKAHRRINNIKEWNFASSEWNNAQQKSIDSLQGTVNAIVAGVPAIVSGLQALQAALEGPVTTALHDLEDGLLAIQDALEDPTTGLVGLNLARPQFGVFDPAGVFLGGTGPVSGFGPTGNAVKGAGPLAGAYVVDFGNDVSSRMYSINQAAGGPAVTPLTTSAVNCASPGADTLCGGIQGVASDSSPNKVAVQFGNAGTAPLVPWTVTAISG